MVNFSATPLIQSPAPGLIGLISFNSLRLLSRPVTHPFSMSAARTTGPYVARNSFFVNFLSMVRDALKALPALLSALWRSYAGSLFQLMSLALSSSSIICTAG